MKKITLFINSLSSGGAEHQISILANQLVEKGYEVTLTTLSTGQDHYCLDARVARKKIGGSRSFAKIARLWYYMITVDTDCFISFCQRNSFFSLPPLFLRRRIRVICGERNLTVGNSDVYEKNLIKYLYRRADAIVSNNHSQEEYLNIVAPHLSSKLSTIINYTNLDEYLVSPLPNNDILRIGVFARFDTQKNCSRFCDAISMLKRNCTTPFEIHWYGNKISGGKVTATYNEVVEKIKTHNLQDTFFIHEPVKKTAPVISEMDAICLPSLFEGFSNSVAEAICCGRPMLVSNISDNGLMVHDKDNGFLFAPEDVESICDAFNSYFNCTTSQREQMAKRSREIATDLFAGDNFINSYIKIIEL